KAGANCVASLSIIAGQMLAKFAIFPAKRRPSRRRREWLGSDQRERPVKLLEKKLLQYIQA
ncbi:MAG: hypothetical protein ACE5J3_13485, partial [Methanosarcinales archaeon]